MDKDGDGAPEPQELQPQPPPPQLRSHGDTNRTIVSNTRKTYAILPSASHQLMSKPRLRAVDRYIALNSSHRHTDRSCAPADVIPPLPFARRAGGGDDVLSLAVTAVDACESALDVPLRFAAPEECFAPALEDPPSRVPLARRIAALLKGRDSVPMHWAMTRAGVTVDDGVTRLRVIADATARAQSSIRAKETLKTARLQCTAAAVHYNGGNVRRAQQSYENALAAFEAVGDARGVAFCHNILGVCHHKLQEFKVALVHHRKQEPLGGCYARAVAQINMSVSYAALGELNFAEQALEDALANARACEDTLIETIALGNLGIVCMRIGNMRAAQTNFELCLEKCSLGGDKSGAAICLLLLGELYSHIQDLKHALFYYEHAFRVGGEAKCADVVDVARVNIGIARGNAALRQAVVQQAERMGQQPELQDVIALLPP